MLYPLKFKPIFKDYIWGGRNLEKLNKELPQGNVAESWEISCHPDGVSIVKEGNLKGKTLLELTKEYGEKLLGRKVTEIGLNEFPLLIKFIDANKRLSVQVHPDDDYAIKNENENNGKTEAWYILKSEFNSNLVYGLKNGITKEKFKYAIEHKKIFECINFIDIKDGDMINIPSGTIHAIGEGILLVEVQQNSNLTYRVYDYDRVGTNGEPRELNIEKALDVITFNDPLEATKLNLNKTCIKNDYFYMKKFKINKVKKFKNSLNMFYIYIFTEGEGKIIYKNGVVKVRIGECVLIPASLEQYSMIGRLEGLEVFMNIM